MLFRSKQSQSLALEEIFTAFNILVNTQEMTKRLDSQRIPLEISLVRLAYKKTESSNLVSGKVLLVNKVETPKINTTVVEHKEQPKKIENIKEVVSLEQEPSLSLENLKDLWGNIVNNLAKIKMSVSTYLSEGQPIKVQGNKVTVGFPKSCLLHKESLDKKDNKDLIEKIIFELTKVNLNLNFILVTEMQLDNDTRSNPVIKSAMDMFGGRVVKEF